MNRRLLNFRGEIQNQSKANIRYNTNNNQRYHNLEKSENVPNQNSTSTKPSQVIHKNNTNINLGHE